MTNCRKLLKCSTILINSSSRQKYKEQSMCRETSIVCVKAYIVCNRAITVSKCDFPVYHVLLAFHEATVLKNTFKT